VEAVIQLIDKGKIITVISSDLFRLTEKYQNIPPTTCELYMTDLIPQDHDENWEPDAMKSLRELFDGYSMKKDCFFTCKVGFVILNKIFVRTIRINEGFEHLKIAGVSKIDVRSYLLDNEFCCEDQTATEKLRALAEAAGIFTGPLSEVRVCVPQTF
jgi:hypothetical protein